MYLCQTKEKRERDFIGAKLIEERKEFWGHLLISATIKIAGQNNKQLTMI